MNQVNVEPVAMFIIDAVTAVHRTMTHCDNPRMLRTIFRLVCLLLHAYLCLVSYPRHISYKQFKIQHIICWKSQIFPTPCTYGTRWGFALQLHQDTWHMWHPGLLHSGCHIMRCLAAFTEQKLVTDGRYSSRCIFHESIVIIINPICINAVTFALSQFCFTGPL